MYDATDLNAVQQDLRTFPSQFYTLHLATIDEQGFPEASYAPYIEHDDVFYVFISALSAHTQNLRHTPSCSVLFIESEDHAQHLFARKRLTFRCTAKEIPRDTQAFVQILDLFEERFGKFMQVIRPLVDFHLIALEPFKASFVAGFARAYTIEGDDLSTIHYRNEVGHRSIDDSIAPSVAEG